MARHIANKTTELDTNRRCNRGVSNSLYFFGRGNAAIAGSHRQLLLREGQSWVNKHRNAETSENLRIGLTEVRPEGR